METTRLHYIYDPFCGWCYASAPLLAAARGLLPVTAHGGGMMAGSNRQPVTDRLRNYVMPHDRRIAAMTGQPFGQAGGEGRDLDLLARLQRAHYVEGRRIADAGVLAEMAADIGLDRPAFEAAYAAREGQPTRDHIAKSRALLAHAGGQGFPTFALERNGRYRVLDTGRYLGHVDEWRAALAELLD